MSLGNAIGIPFNPSVGNNSIYEILGDRIVLHVDASDTSTLWKDQAGTTPLSNHNEYARRVDNKAFLYQSAYGNTSTNPLAKFYISVADSNANSPQWVQNASGVNGYSALYFGGGAQGLYASMASLAEGAVYDPTSGISGYSAESYGSGFWQTWIVLKGSGTVSSEETIFCEAMKNGGPACGNSDLEFSININGTDSQWEQKIGSNVKDSTVASTSNFELWTFKGPGVSGNRVIYRNGDPSDGATMADTNISSYRRVVGASQDCTALSIGCNINNDASTFSKNWNGYLFEIVIAVRNATTYPSEITAMDNYLMNKYNIS